MIDLEAAKKALEPFDRVDPSDLVTGKVVLSLVRSIRSLIKALEDEDERKWCEDMGDDL